MLSKSIFFILTDLVLVLDLDLDLDLLDFIVCKFFLDFFDFFDFLF